MKQEEPKSLIVNDVLYANYIIENGTLFVKTRRNIVKDDANRSESVLVELISLIERKKIKYVSYLNIK